jgi:hypothetical protein
MNSNMKTGTKIPTGKHERDEVMKERERSGGH